MGRSTVRSKGQFVKAAGVQKLRLQRSGGEMNYDLSMEHFVLVFTSLATLFGCLQCIYICLSMAQIILDAKCHGYSCTYTFN